MTVWRQCCTAYKHSLIKHGPSVKKTTEIMMMYFFLLIWKTPNMQSLFFLCWFFPSSWFVQWKLIVTVCLLLQEIWKFKEFLELIEKSRQWRNFDFCKLDEQTDTSTFVNQLQLRLLKPNCLLWSQTRKNVWLLELHKQLLNYVKNICYITVKRLGDKRYWTSVFTFCTYGN